MIALNNTDVQWSCWLRTGPLRSGDRRAKFIANTVQGGPSSAPPDLTPGSWAFSWGNWPVASRFCGALRGHGAIWCYPVSPLEKKQTWCKPSYFETGMKRSALAPFRCQVLSFVWLLLLGSWLSTTYFPAGLKGKERILLFNSVKPTPRPGVWQEKVSASPNMHNGIPQIRPLVC